MHCSLPPIKPLSNRQAMPSSISSSSSSSSQTVMSPKPSPVVIESNFFDVYEHGRHCVEQGLRRLQRDDYSKSYGLHQAVSLLGGNYYEQDHPLNKFLLAAATSYVQTKRVKEHFKHHVEYVNNQLQLTKKDWINLINIKTEYIKSRRAERIQEFERCRDEILDDVPPEMRAEFGCIGFSKLRTNRLPVLMLNPFSVPPGPIRDAWFNMYDEAEANEDFSKLKHLVHWYGDWGEKEYSLVPRKHIIPYKEGVTRGYHKLPQSIANKLRTGEPLRPVDARIVRAFKEVEEELPKEPHERKTFHHDNWMEAYDFPSNFDEDTDEEIDDSGSSVASESRASSNKVAKMPPKTESAPKSPSPLPTTSSGGPKNNNHFTRSVVRRQQNQSDKSVDGTSSRENSRRKSYGHENDDDEHHRPHPQKRGSAKRPISDSDLSSPMKRHKMSPESNNLDRKPAARRVSKVISEPKEQRPVVVADTARSIIAAAAARRTRNENDEGNDISGSDSEEKTMGKFVKAKYGQSVPPQQEPAAEYSDIRTLLQQMNNRLENLETTVKRSLEAMENKLQMAIEEQVYFQDLLEKKFGSVHDKSNGNSKNNNKNQK